MIFSTKLFCSVYCLQPSTVLGSIDVVYIMSCKIDFHVVRSVLQISMCIFFITAPYYGTFRMSNGSHIDFDECGEQILPVSLCARWRGKEKVAFRARKKREERAKLRRNANLQWKIKPRRLQKT